MREREREKEFGERDKENERVRGLVVVRNGHRGVVEITSGGSERKSCLPSSLN